MWVKTKCVLTSTLVTSTTLHVMYLILSTYHSSGTYVTCINPGSILTSIYIFKLHDNAWYLSVSILIPPGKWTTTISTHLTAVHYGRWAVHTAGMLRVAISYVICYIILHDRNLASTCNVHNTRWVVHVIDNVRDVTDSNSYSRF